MLFKTTITITTATTLSSSLVLANAESEWQEMSLIGQCNDLASRRGTQSVFAPHVAASICLRFSTQNYCCCEN